MLVLSGLMSGSLLWSARAQEAPIGPSSPPTTAPPELNQSESVNPNAGAPRLKAAKPEEKPGETKEFPAGVDEILKMLQAGVSTNVIKAYIETSPVAYNLGAGDIIALKKHGVPDDLTTAMVTRGGTLRAQASQSGNLKAFPVVYPGRNRSYGMLDPEGYDYFQYYYLYPRTLAEANQRFYAPNGSSLVFAPYGHGFFGPRPFQPLSPSAFRPR
jgi:hypothetical protein